jgi:hypothetical protein
LREVGEGLDVVVGEVEALMVFGDDAEVLDGGDLVTLEHAHTL